MKNEKVFIPLITLILSLAVSTPSYGQKLYITGDSINRDAVSQVSADNRQTYALGPMGGDDECCSTPGHADECWYFDAQSDGIACTGNSDCISGNCDTSEGLCTCENDNQCNNGTDKLGICSVSRGLCGPSYCNGYFVCSCWGGCEPETFGSGTYDNPSELCADTASGFPGFCCDGNFPSSPQGLGFCASSASDCGGGASGGCTKNSDCIDHAGNSCVNPLCMDNECIYPAGNAGNCLPGSPGANCCCNVDSQCPDGPCVASTTCDTTTSSLTYHQCIFTWDPAGPNPGCDFEGSPSEASDSCGTWECDALHQCSQVLHENDSCEDMATPQTDDICGEYTCNADATCSQKFTALGTPCDDSVPGGIGGTNDVCGEYNCDGSGGCVEYTNPADPCDELNGGEVGFINDACGVYTCNVDGTCSEKTATFGGQSCADASHIDTVCEIWLCDGSGNCAQTAFTNAPCDEDNGGQTGDTNDTCGVFTCNADGSCTEKTVIFSGVSCADGSHIDGTCKTWACDGLGSCEQNNTASGVSCDAEVDMDTDDICGAWACNGSGDCEEIHAGTSVSCDAEIDTDTDEYCGKWRCDGSGNCNEVYEHTGSACNGEIDECAIATCAAGECEVEKENGDSCTPGAVDYCREYECQGGTCTDVGDLFSAPSITHETCQGQSISQGNSEEQDNACSDDDISIGGSGVSPRFASMDAKSDTGDYVYDVEMTVSDYFELSNSLVTVNPAANSMDRSNNSDWDPLLYSQTTCGSSSTQYTASDDCDFSGTGYDGIDCGTYPDYSALTVGPWPVRDNPSYSFGDSDDWDSNSVTDGYVVDNTKDVYLIVDSNTPTTPTFSGGEYEITVSAVTEHINDDCRSSAAYLGAPVIDGTQDWKERWRGNTDSYDNFLCDSADDNPNVRDDDSDCIDDDTGTPLGPSCWSGASGDYNLNDPKAAYFRIDLPAGDSYKIYVDEAGTTWDGTGAPGGNPYNGANYFSQVLTFWGDGTAGDISCLGSLNPGTTIEDCTGGTADYPREKIFTGGDWSGWASISNNVPGESGDYELNIVKNGQSFLGFSERFVGADTGCGTGTASWSMEGYRLDFIPTGTAINGYILVGTNVGVGSDGGWLVHPTNHVGGAAVHWSQVCSGAACATTRSPMPLNFQMPVDGDFYPYYCIDAAGRIDFREDSSGTCSWDIWPDSEEQTSAYSPSVSALWGDIIPCWRSNRTWVCDQRFWWWCIAGHYEWSGSCRSGKNGVITRQTIPFEGTTATVVTWDGFDGYINPSRDRANINNSLRFQVIIRLDGRITLYYRQPSNGAAWDDILGSNSWTVGINGTNSLFCNGNGDVFCNTSYSTTGIECDDEDFEKFGKTLYEAKDYCIKPVTDIHNGMEGP